jgi:hypothetical protein
MKQKIENGKTNGKRKAQNQLETDQKNDRKKNKNAKKPSAWNVCGPAHLGNMGTCQAVNRSEEVRVNVKIVTIGDE